MPFPVGSSGSWNRRLRRLRNCKAIPFYQTCLRSRFQRLSFLPACCPGKECRRRQIWFVPEFEEGCSCRSLSLDWCSRETEKREHSPDRKSTRLKSSHTDISR